jgi:hypothetical protein
VDYFSFGMSASKIERAVSSFASLLSSALALNDGAEPTILNNSAQLLKRFICREVVGNQYSSMIPSFLLKHTSFPPSTGTSLEESTALNLARPLSLKPSELSSAPLIVLANVTDSFKTLVDARLRSSTKALIRRSHEMKDSTMTRILVGLLAGMDNPIVLSTVVTSFRTIPNYEINQSQVTMPLIIECVIDLKIFGKLESITVAAPGIIQTFHSNKLSIVKAEIILDTLSLLQGMMKQARKVVRKAVESASSIAKCLLAPTSLLEPDEIEQGVKRYASQQNINQHIASNIVPSNSQGCKRSYEEFATSLSQSEVQDNAEHENRKRKSEDPTERLPAVPIESSLQLCAGGNELSLVNIEENRAIIS